MFKDIDVSKDIMAAFNSVQYPINFWNFFFFLFSFFLFSKKPITLLNLILINICHFRMQGSSQC